jgi:hypothetical protein
MSGHDVLAEASRALCDQASAPSPDASRTRSLVLLRASRRERRSRLVVMLAPIAAVVGISTAWASTHEGAVVWTRVAGLVGAFEAKSERHGSKPVEVPVALPVAPVPQAAAESPGPMTSAEVPVLRIDDLPRARAVSLERRGAAERPVPEPEAQAAPHASLPVDDDAPRLYAAAHHAHFVARDPAEALRAWDEFLAFAPDDPLAPEARYNRALTLVRLDRRAEARGALEPFAHGAYGSYRQREARALIDALGR